MLVELIGPAQSSPLRLVLTLFSGFGACLAGDSASQPRVACSAASFSSQLSWAESACRIDILLHLVGLQTSAQPACTAGWLDCASSYKAFTLLILSLWELLSESSTCSRLQKFVMIGRALHCSALSMPVLCSHICKATHP